jgi:hypothetical protein
VEWIPLTLYTEWGYTSMWQRASIEVGDLREPCLLRAAKDQVIELARRGYDQLRTDPQMKMADATTAPEGSYSVAPVAFPASMWML